MIAQIEPGSPAERADLRASDLATTVNGRRVRNSNDLRNAVGLLRIGDKITMDVVRDKRKLELTAAIGERPSQAATLQQDFTAYLAGATFAEIQGAKQGVLVDSVQRGSPAANAGLVEGDIVVSVNQEAVQSVANFRQAVQQSGSRLMLQIQRGSQEFYLLLES